MSDTIYHDIDHSPDTVEVTSGDIVRSGPIERGVAIDMTDDSTTYDQLNVIKPEHPEMRAELYRGMAFEADRSLKIEREKNEALRHLVQAADNELAHWQRDVPGGQANRLICNARAALTKAKETA